MYANCKLRASLIEEQLSTCVAQEQSGRVDWNAANVNEDGFTPVTFALEERMLEVMEVLMECPQVDVVNLRDKEGWSLLMRSIEGNNLGEYPNCLASYF